MCRLHIDQINELSEIEKKLGRALTREELRNKYGHVNAKGQYVWPPGSPQYNGIPAYTDLIW